ncbi:MAG: undecaprenyl-diphosphatase UppP [Gemmataceae bacterium]
MTIWQAALLGLVQGLTEFLPISSTAHLLAVRTFLGHDHPEDAFTVVIQLGTLVAVFAYFRSDIAKLLLGLLGDLRAFRPGSNDASRTAGRIALGTVPAVVVGFLFKKQLKETFFNLHSVAIVSIMFALLLAAAELWSRRRTPRGEESITWLDSLWIGLWQACALMPGGSRSGTTITGGLFAGLSRSAAARFSFLLSMPVILGAGLKDLYDEFKKWRSPIPGDPPSLFASADDVTALVVGTLVSAVSGYLAIAWLLGFLQRRSTTVFIVYRLLFGTLLLLALAAS